jgi:protocatechuate 3,4-dioxygenase beta subunit
MLMRATQRNDTGRARSAGLIGLWLAALVIVATLGAGAWLALTPAAEFDEVAELGAAERRAAAALVVEPRPADAPAGEPARAEVGAEETTDDAPAATVPPTLRGRVLDAAGQPLAAQLSLRRLQPGAPSDGQLWVTGADGAFALPLPPLTPVEVTIRAPRHAPRVAPVGRTPLGQEVALGDVYLQAGRRVVGRVVDNDGMPVDDVVVEARRSALGSELKRATRPLRVAEVRTGQGGGFAFPEPLPAGKWNFDVAGRRFAVDEDGKTFEAYVAAAARARTSGSASAQRRGKPPGAVEFESSDSELVLELVVKPVAAGTLLAGDVRDAAGRPIGGAQVYAFDAEGRRVTSVQAATDGRFELQGEKRPAGERVRLRAELSGFEGELGRESFAWGARDAVAFLQQGASLAVRVTDLAGQSVERFTLHVFPSRTADLADLRARSDGRHADGLALASGLLDGDYAVCVTTPKGQLVQDGVHRLRLHGAAARVDLQLAPPVYRRVRVLRHGQPVEAAIVELLAPVEHAPLREAMPAAKLMDLWTCKGERALRVISAMTDARGEVLVHGHPQTRYGLRVRTARGVPSLSEVVLGTAPDVIEVTPLRGARVEGSLQPEGLVAQMLKTNGAPPRLSLQSRSGEQELRRETERPLGADGAFVFDEVPAGDWRVVIEWRQQFADLREIEKSAARTPDKPRAGGGASVKVEPDRHDSPEGLPGIYTKNRGQNRELALLQALGERELRRVDVMARELLCAELQAEVVLGQAPGPHRVYFVEVDPSQSTPQQFFARADELGRVRALLPAGTWRCDVSGPSCPRQPIDGRLQLAAGQSATARLVAALRQVALRVRTATDQPADHVRLTLRREGAAPIELPPATAEGAVSAYLPLGKFTAHHGEHALGEVVVGEGSEPIVLRLPQ